MTIDDGYRFAVITTDSNGIILSDTGWRTEYSIPSNTVFYVVVKKSDNSDIELNEISCVHFYFNDLLDHGLYNLKSSIKTFEDSVNQSVEQVIANSKYYAHSLLLGFNSYIDYNTSNGTITIPRDTIFIAHHANGTANFKVLNSGGDIVISGVNYETMQTTAIKLLLNTSTWEFSVISYTTPIPANCILIANIRMKRGNYPGMVSSPTPWRIDNNPYGIALDSIDFTDYKHIGALVKSVNHRGWHNAPENTLIAYKLSRKNGFSYVETDVGFTSDGVAVLLHDTTINRTARTLNGEELPETININDITYGQALEYDFGIYKGEQYAGTKIPTLEEFCAFCKKIGLHPYIEIKTAGMTETNVKSIIKTAYANGLRGNCTFISFNEVYLGYIKDVDDSARLGYLNTYGSDITQSDISKAQALKTNSNDVFIDVRISGLTSNGITLASDAGFPVEVYDGTLSNILTMPSYITGVTADSVIADRVLYDNAMT